MQDAFILLRKNLILADKKYAEVEAVSKK